MEFELVEIEEIKEIDYDGTVIDLTVEEDSSYNVGGIIVHNSACTTRIMTGIGRPQLSAIRDVCLVKKEYPNVKVIADGGIKEYGDVAKALGRGADFVMIGNLFSGTKETPGDVLTLHDGRKVKIYEGSASLNNQIKYQNRDHDEVLSEGVSTFVSYKGSIKNIVPKMAQALRNSLCYCGCRNLEEFRDYCSDSSVWNKISHASLVESYPHIANKTAL